MKKLLLLLALLSVNANATTEKLQTNIEHQIRICDTNENIIAEFNLKKNFPIEMQSKKFKIYYAETREHTYSDLKWSIRFREKNSKVEITVKKKMNLNEEKPKYSNVVCEYDMHGATKEYSCKINSEIPASEFEKVLSNKKNWTKVLDLDQYDFLKENNVVFENAQIYGILEANRFQWTDNNFGLITVDLVHLNHNSSTTFNEISIRYPVGSPTSLSKSFENYVAQSGVIACANQIDWAVDKFQVLEILN